MEVSKGKVDSIKAGVMVGHNGGGDNFLPRNTEIFRRNLLLSSWYFSKTKFARKAQTNLCGSIL